MRKQFARGIAATLLTCGLATAPAPPRPTRSTSRSRASRCRTDLTVVVSEDHKAPVVAVSVWYHIGSADEPKGKTGFAHLFEHLMFQGSENHKDEFFRPFELAGATDQNGTTWFDRTNYYETVPTTALDMTLWMESDRMGHLLGAIGQKELDEQRGVVQNEKRQGENQPYGRVDERMVANAFPANHPYHHDTIGSMKDLDAASLGDVKQWFAANYGAANVTVALVGDITPEVAKAKMLEYFGDIPAGPPVPRQQPWTAPRTESTRDTMEDHVAQTRIYRQWNVPWLGDPEETQLELAAAVLGGGKTSRLYERLVYKDKLADDVSVDVQSFALASMLQLQADVKHGVDPAKVEAAIAEEWARFLKDGPTDDELARVKVNTRAVVHPRSSSASTARRRSSPKVRSIAAIPARTRATSRASKSATPASVLAAAKKWIAQGRLHADRDAGGRRHRTPKSRTRRKRPDAPRSKDVRQRSRRRRGDYRVAKSAVARDKGVPVSPSSRICSFPKFERGKLKNGIEVILAQRHAIPVVQMQLLFDAGYASDHGRGLGTSAFTMAMLDEGTTTLDSLEIARRAGTSRRADQRRFGARHVERRSQRAVLADRALARAVRRHRAQFRVPRRGHRAHPRPVARAHRAGEDAAARSRAAHAAAAAVRRRSRVCDSVHRLGHRAGDHRAEREGSARVRRRLPATRQREDPDRRRHDARCDHSAARRGVRRLESAGDAAREEEHRDGRAHRPSRACT